MAVIQPTDAGLVLLETMAGFSVADVIAATDAALLLAPQLRSVT
jgi:acyl CoA:acetate/3-ketoacid CoA transferase beta subunit